MKGRKVYFKKWYQKNRDRLIAKQREYYKNNQEKILRYREENKG